MELNWKEDSNLIRKLAKILLGDTLPNGKPVSSIILLDDTSRAELQRWANMNDAEFAAAQFVFNVAFAIQNMFFVTQHHAGAAVVDVLHNGSNLRMFLAQGLDEVVLGREYRGCGDQHHHDLAAGEAAADQHVA